MVGDESMPEMDLKQPGSTYSACGTFTKNKERIKKCRQEIQIIFTRIILIKLVASMIWLVVNRKIWVKEQNSIKF